MALRNIATLLLLLLGISVNAQNSSNIYNPYTDNDSFEVATPTLSPVKFNLMTGAVFSSGTGSGSLFNSYVAPSFSQNLGKKLTLSSGAIISNTTYSNLNLISQDGNFRPYSGNMTNFTVYAVGAYQVNDRLTVNGSAYKTINPAFNARLNADNLQMEAQGMSLGFGYKLSENVHLGAEIRMQQGNSNFCTPFGIPGGNPFYGGLYR